MARYFSVIFWCYCKTTIQPFGLGNQTQRKKFYPSIFAVCFMPPNSCHINFAATIILIISMHVQTRISLVFASDSSSENCDTMEQLNKMIRKFESLSATKTTPDSSGSQNRIKPNSSETNSYIERLRLNNAIR